MTEPPLIEQMMDAYQSGDNRMRSSTDPDRMLAVVDCITKLLQSQGIGELLWAGEWLHQRLEVDGSLDHAPDELGRTGYEQSVYRWGRGGEGTYALRADNTKVGIKVPYRVIGKTCRGQDFASSGGMWQLNKPCTYDDWLRCCGVNGYKGGLL